MRFEVFGKTDAGIVRTENQDAYRVVSRDVDGRQLGVIAIADGVGGGKHGEVASAMFCDLVAQQAAMGKALRAYTWERDRSQRREALEQLDSVMGQVAALVHTRSREEAALSGMATTGITLVAADQGAFLGHVGDSRAYLIRGPKVFRLTDDHTITNQMVRDGLLGADEAADHPFAGSLSRAIGPKPRVEVDTLFVKTEPGDRFVLCTDGLHRYLGGTEIHQAASTITDRAALAAHLIRTACEHGGEDNVTVVVVDVTADAPVPPSSEVGLGTQLGLMHGTFLFDKMNEQEILRVMQIGHIVQFREGDAIVEEGSASDAFFVVLQGQCNVYKGPELLATIGRGGHFGELGLIDAGERSADVIAASAVECMAMSRDDLFALFRDDRDLANKILMALLLNIAGRVRSLSTTVKRLGDLIHDGGPG